jgi:hypothetical protein
VAAYALNTFAELAMVYPFVLVMFAGYLTGTLRRMGLCRNTADDTGRDNRFEKEIGLNVLIALKVATQ